MYSLSIFFPNIFLIKNIKSALKEFFRTYIIGNLSDFWKMSKRKKALIILFYLGGE